MYFLSLKVTACSHSHSAAVGTIAQKTTGDSAPPSRQTSSAEQPAPRFVRFCLVLSRSVSSCPATCARRTTTAARATSVVLSFSTLLYFALSFSAFLYLYIQPLLEYLLFCIYYYSVYTTATCYYYIIITSYYYAITITCYYYIILLLYYMYYIYPFCIIALCLVLTYIVYIIVLL